MRMKKKNYLQVYLEECKYKIKKIKKAKFISTELESKLESESETELELKSDSESCSFFTHIFICFNTSLFMTACENIFDYS